ncbi:hypothetical protein [Glycocaulis sp.]
MKLTFDAKPSSIPGVWLAPVHIEDTSRLQTGSLPKSSRTIIGLVHSNWDDKTKSLTASFSDVIVFAKGASDEAVLIDMGRFPSIPDKVAPLGSPDDMFLASARLHVGAEGAKLIEKVLKQVRQRIVGEFRLIEGDHRKWTANPNFLAITLQNRKKRFRVSVNELTENLNPQSLELIMGRPPYREFFLEREEQIGDAVEVIVTSARKHFTVKLAE